MQKTVCGFRKKKIGGNHLIKVLFNIFQPQINTLTIMVLKFFWTHRSNSVDSVLSLVIYLYPKLRRFSAHSRIFIHTN